MSLKNIDTFEQDIAQELKKKEVAVREAPPTSRTVGNIQQEAPERRSPIIFIVLGILMLSTLTGSSYFGYTFYVNALNPPQAVIQATLPVVKTKTSMLAEISPSFPDAIGMFVTNVTKNQYGYTVSISSFSPVYAYMLRNEKDFGDDVARSLGVERGTMSTPIIYDAATLTTSTATTSTSSKPTVGGTKNTSTTTVATTTTPPPPLIVPVDTSSIIVPFTFSDTTVSNQNIRVGTSGQNSFYYAFIDNKALVFSASVEGILTLKNAILR